MGIDHVTVTLEHKNGLSRDRVVNSFTFRSPGDFVTAADADAIDAVLTQFYNGVHAPATRSIASYLGVSMSRTVPPIVRHYDVTNDLSGTPSGSPLFMRNLPTINVNVSANGLPNEIAYVLTFAASFGADVEFAPGSRPRSRDRGRVYLGPLNQDCMTSSGVGSATEPTGSFIDVVRYGGAFLRDDPDTELVVWSRSAAGVKPVVSVWCDNAFDVQRRRGERPTLKSVA
jgi:hypothetical protein